MLSLRQQAHLRSHQQQQKQQQQVQKHQQQQELPWYDEDTPVWGWTDQNGNKQVSTAMRPVRMAPLPIYSPKQVFAHPRHATALTRCLVQVFKSIVRCCTAGAILTVPQLSCCCGLLVAWLPCVCLPSAATHVRNNFKNQSCCDRGRSPSPMSADGINNVASRMTCLSSTSARRLSQCG